MFKQCKIAYPNLIFVIINLFRLKLIFCCNIRITVHKSKSSTKLSLMDVPIGFPPPLARVSALSIHNCTVYFFPSSSGPIYTCMAYNINKMPTAPPCSVRSDDISCCVPGVIVEPPLFHPLSNHLYNRVHVSLDHF